MEAAAGADARRAGAASGRSALKRSLGPLHLTLMGVGASIGAGIFVFTGVAAREAGLSLS